MKTTENQILYIRHELMWNLIFLGLYLWLVIELYNVGFKGLSLTPLNYCILSIVIAYLVNATYSNHK